RAVIRDAETGRMGSAGQFIQVPDLSKNRLEISGLILTSFETEPGQKPATEQRDDIQPTPGVRRFSRGSTVAYREGVVNSALDPKPSKPQLNMQLEIYHDGKVLHQFEPRQLDPGDAAAPKRLDCSGRLKLTSFPPGDYMMRLVVTDHLANPKYSHAEQWMDFSVR